MIDLARKCEELEDRNEGLINGQMAMIKEIIRLSSEVKACREQLAQNRHTIITELNRAGALRLRVRELETRLER